MPDKEVIRNKKYLGVHLQSDNKVSTWTLVITVLAVLLNLTPATTQCGASHTKIVAFVAPSMTFWFAATFSQLLESPQYWKVGPMSRRSAKDFRSFRVCTAGMSSWYNVDWLLMITAWWQLLSHADNTAGVGGHCSLSLFQSCIFDALSCAGSVIHSDTNLTKISISSLITVPGHWFILWKTSVILSHTYFFLLLILWLAKAWMPLLFCGTMETHSSCMGMNPSQKVTLAKGNSQLL